MLDLRQSGYAQMLIAEGRAKGLAENRAEGRAEGWAESIIDILDARRVHLSSATRMKILGCRDLDLLKQWLLLAFDGHEANLWPQIEALKDEVA